MTTPIDTLRELLQPAEFARLAALIDRAPASTVVSQWVDRLSAAIIAAKIEGEVASCLLVHAPTAAEGEAAAGAIAENIAALFARTRDAREAAADAIRKAAH